ncbi:exported protein of unknown function [Candidatus Promineifilum breve]|uniref:Lipoprotein n=1 Tax=Candidatus Promineifilum breve TaxID=1806508 RepID=A0A160T6J8_9CHLR|nr:hypothetical protein [Candidatus Promineifilum breve]CUS04888.2 exported protein of unknown function [Candidatus Promineifilum breve]
MRAKGRLLLGIALGLVAALAACDDAPPTSPPTVSSPLPTDTAAPPPTAAPTDTPAPTPTPVTPVEGGALALIRAFVDAPYRVVAVARNPFAPYTLITATERAAADCGSPEAPQRCTSDETCGSLYTSSPCFFFVEPSFDATADPATRYVARWPDEATLSALVIDSFRFIDARTVEFRAEGGDGAYSVQEVWWLDLVTGAVALQNRVESGS